MATVSLDNLCKRYERSADLAVDHVSLAVAHGEFMVLLGPSGCGKSTTLRMIAGLEAISSGELAIDGRVVNEVPAKDRDIAMVFQSYALYPHMTVRDNLGFGLKIAKQPEAEIVKRVDQAAEILGLGPYMDRLPAHLSGGQRQRVAMGRAIVRRPQVYLMDEPLSNLDAKLRVQTRTELVELQARLAVTTVYVTHDQVEAMTMGDRVAVLRDGILQQCDTPSALYHAPANLFVAGFIGSPAMNQLHVSATGPLMIGGADVGIADDVGGERAMIGFRRERHAHVRQHAVDHGGGDGPEPLAQLQRAGHQLDQAGHQQERAQHRKAVLGDDLEDNDGQARGGAADLQGRAGQGADDDPADDARDQAALSRDAGGDGDAHAQRHRHQEDDDRGGEVTRQDRREAELAARRLLGGGDGGLGHSAAMPRWSAATMRRDGRWATGSGAPS